MLNHVFTLVVGALLMGSMVAYLLYRFGRFNRSHTLAYFLIFLSWFLTFYTKFLIPIDVVSTTYRQCLKHDLSLSVEPSNVTCSKPWNYLEPEAFKILWRFIYWTMQFLSIIALPVIQTYSLSGHFTFGGKMRDALCKNAIYYGTLFGLCLIFLFYLFMNPSYGGLSFENIKTIASSASNTWGMVNLIVLMGYGLVDIPRTLWYRSNNTRSYKKTVFSLSKKFDEKEAALDRLHFFVNKLKEMGSEILSNQNQERYDKIASKLPLEFRNMETDKNRVRSHLIIYENGGDTDPVTACYTSFMCCCRPKSDEYYLNAPVNVREQKQQDDLVCLNFDIMVSMEEVDRTRSEFYTSLQKAIHLDDIMNAISAGNGTFQSSLYRRALGVSVNVWPRFSYFWYVYAKPFATIFLCLITSAASLVIFWCELTFSITKPTLSLFAIVVHHLKQSSANGGWAFEIFCFTALIYMALCTHTTVFKIKLFHFCCFVDDHQTSLRSFFFSAALLSRLTIALSLNFLAMAHLDAGQLIKLDESLYTSFVSIMGKLQLFPLLRDYFNVYYPLVIALVFLMTLFRLGSKLSNCLGVQTFADDENSDSTLSEGQDIMRRERHKFIETMLRDRWRRSGSDEMSQPLINDMEVNSFADDMSYDQRL